MGGVVKWKRGAWGAKQCELEAGREERCPGGRSPQDSHTLTEETQLFLGRKGKLFLINTVNCSPEYTRAWSLAHNSNKINKTVSCVLQALSYKYTGKKRHAVCSHADSICPRQ